MSGKTGIQWTNVSWNPTIGCDRVSAGCDHCYAFELHDTRFNAWRKGNFPTAPQQYQRPFSAKYVNPATHAPQGIQLLYERLGDPLSWRKGVMCFVNSMSDLGHEDIPDDFLRLVYGVMAMTPRHTFQILTKRPERLRDLARRLDATHCFQAFANNARAQQTIGRVTWTWNCRHMTPISSVSWPLLNVWHLASAEHQDALDERGPHITATRSVVRGLSVEPMLGPLDLARYLACPICDGYGVETLHWLPKGPENVLCRTCEGTGRGLDWVIIGGESGRHARPVDLAWMRDLIAQCRSAGIAIFVKQLGSVWAHERRNQRFATHDHGGNPSEWPSDLRIREWPDVAHRPMTDDARRLVAASR